VHRRRALRRRGQPPPVTQALPRARRRWRAFADLPRRSAAPSRSPSAAFRPGLPILPRFVAGDDTISETEQSRLEAAELRRQAEQGLRQRLAGAPPAPGFTAADYDTRLAYELDVIARMKFPGYFLIVADFIKWAKAQGIPVGPGRGSGAGSSSPGR
jgi:DNA polymerase-3 subunit alpha